VHSGHSKRPLVSWCGNGKTVGKNYGMSGYSNYAIGLRSMAAYTLSMLDLLEARTWKEKMLIWADVPTVVGGTHTIENEVIAKAITDSILNDSPSQAVEDVVHKLYSGKYYTDEEYINSISGVNYHMVWIDILDNIPYITVHRHGCLADLVIHVCEHQRLVGPITNTENQTSSSLVSYRRILSVCFPDSTVKHGDGTEHVGILRTKLLDAIFTGSKYPEELLHRVINRYKVEMFTADNVQGKQRLDLMVRIMRAVLVRNYHKEVYMEKGSLECKDVPTKQDNESTAYALGRWLRKMEQLYAIALKEKTSSWPNTKPVSSKLITFMSNPAVAVKEVVSTVNAVDPHAVDKTCDLLGTIDTVPRRFRNEENAEFILGYAYQSKLIRGSKGK